MAYVSSRPTKRQQDKIKERTKSSLFFLVEWKDYDSHSVVNARLVLHHSLDTLERGDVVEVKDGSEKYKATVVASGSQEAMEELQSQYLDSDSDNSDTNSTAATTPTRVDDNSSAAMTSEPTIPDKETTKKKNKETITPTKKKRKRDNPPTSSKVKPKRQKLTEPLAKAAHQEVLKRNKYVEDALESNLYETSQDILNSIGEKTKSPSPKKTSPSAKKNTPSKKRVKKAIIPPKTSPVTTAPNDPLDSSGSPGVSPLDLAEVEITSNERSKSVESVSLDDGLPVRSQFTPPTNVPIRKAHSDTSTMKMPSSFLNYGPSTSSFSADELPYNNSLPPMLPQRSFGFSRSPTPFSDASSFYSGYNRAYDNSEVYSVITSLREDVNKLSREVETLKGELHRKSRKSSKDKIYASRQETGFPHQSVSMTLSTDIVKEEGCWFGVKNDDKLGVFIPGIKACDLASVDTSTNAGALSQSLTELLFTHQEMSTGCATKPRKPGIVQLDSKKLHAIRVHLSYRFPVGAMHGPEESKRWKEVKSNKINVKCRQYRNKTTADLLDE